MNDFVKYQHLERFGTDEVDGINIGTCYIFPKLDGTNASAWIEDGAICGGSRNRKLSLDDDNAGFLAWLLEQENLAKVLTENPDLRFYGEWLVPHSLKTYRSDAWRRFYVFDVMREDGTYMSFDEYKLICDAYAIDYIPCTCKAKNPTYEVLHEETLRNKYLLQENSGHGEGVVIKNYDYKNKFGRAVWAKLITNTFKDKHIKEMGGTSIEIKMVEEEIVAEFVTPHMVDKVVEKIRLQQGAFNAKNIPQLLGMTFHDLVTEELWEAIKKHKNPKIDFKTLHHFTVRKIKEVKRELFGG